MQERTIAVSGFPEAGDLDGASSGLRDMNDDGIQDVIWVEGEVVRGVRTNRVRCSSYEMEFPEVPTGASFFSQQAKAGTR